MAKIKSKGKSGAAKNYITRNQALKKLQVTLADFRRLCIFKGIYPREPRNRKKANKGSTAPTTFYYSKDIQYLLHEPIIDKIREHKTFTKKFNRALSRKEYEIAKSLQKIKPSYTLDHIIKERYPTFLDAIRDLDDALSMLSLFSSVHVTDKIDSSIISNCERLCLEFQNYVIISKSLRKAFLSIKGIYYQIEIKGQEIIWLVPYKFSQKIPVDVDLRIMLTFLEFYQTFVSFVNFKLYNDLGLTYPPPVNISLLEGAGDISAYNLEKLRITQIRNEPEGKELKDTENQVATLNKKLDKIFSEISFSTHDNLETPENTNDEMVLDDFSVQSNSNNFPNELLQPVTSNSKELNIFEHFVFYLSREVPRYSLEFVIRSFGGKVGWDPVLGSGSPFKEDDTQITHQIYDRPSLDKKNITRVYVQPQWVYDCINRKKILDTDEYKPGSLLPPHLSPFVNIDDEYNSETKDDSDDTDQDNLDNNVNGHKKEDSQETSTLPLSHYIEKVKKSNKTEETKQEEAKNLAKTMLTNKQRKLYKKMIYSNLKKKEEIDRLRKKRKELMRTKKEK
ncbi:hypothetical protein PORY_002728 [Pneumocystis oryctolagi]|uniref:Uncharacterized protein n=1 Tax=Pneumocystis oryctolagi TaxID=42067 RepID=A0ACB7CG04_9ASCO|nr:hypothetical protein PORY_002728 [Pneumocystis oryctolagi]